MLEPSPAFQSNGTGATNGHQNNSESVQLPLPLAAASASLTF